MTVANAQPIRIESVRVRDIYDFACRSAAQVEPGAILPISRQRALAWSKNPYADGDDVALWVAYHGEQCVGYQGVMPGRLRVDGVSHKVLWTSTLFVAPEFRKFQVALLLNKAAVSSANDCLAVGPSLEAQAFLRLLRWQVMRPAVVVELRFGAGHLVTGVARACLRAATRLGAGPRVADWVRRALDWADRVVYPVEKAIYRPFVASSTRQLLGEQPWRVVPRFEASDQIDGLLPAMEPGFVRGRDAINWMIDYPWLVERGQSPDDSRHYRFSNVRDAFRYIPVVLGPAGGPAVGFAVFSVSTRHSRTTLKLFDFGPAGPETCARLAGLSLQLASSWSADVIEWPAPVAAALAGHTWTRRLTRERALACFGWSHAPDSPVARAAASVELSPADGDLAFT